MEEGEKPSRGDAGNTGSWRREGPLLPPSHRLFPARLTHGERQKKLRRRDTPPELHTHTRTFARTHSSGRARSRDCRDFTTRLLSRQAR